MNTDLLERLTNTAPALRQSGEPEEPRDWEPREIETRGRSPDEVVSRERGPVERFNEETTMPAAPRKPQTQPRQTYDEPVQEQTYEAPQEAPQVPATITNEMVARVYDPISKIIDNELAAAGLFTEEFRDFIPERDRLTMIGQMRFAFDKIFQLEATVRMAVSRLEQTITFLNQAKDQAEGQSIAAQYSRQLDALVKKDPQLYGRLREKSVRDGFTQFLVEEVGTTVEAAIGPRSLSYLSKQWLAFNSGKILSAAGRNADNKRFVTGAGSNMLERMIANSGRSRG